MRRLLALVTVSLFLIACGGPVEVRQHSVTGQLSASGHTQAGMQSGTWTYYHDNGALRGIGRWERDKQAGPWQFWYANGQLEQEGAYSMGQRSGQWTFYFTNGQIRAQGYYEQERQQGLWTYFHDNSQLAAQGLFLAGERVGVWTWYDQSGNKIEQGSYLAGRKIGPWFTKGEWRRLGSLADGRSTFDDTGMWFQHTQEHQVYTWRRHNGNASLVASLRRGQQQYVQWWDQDKLTVAGIMQGQAWLDKSPGWPGFIDMTATSTTIATDHGAIDLGTRGMTKQERQDLLTQAQQAVIQLPHKPVSKVVQRPTQRSLAPIALDALSQTLELNPLSDLSGGNWTQMDHGKAQQSAKVYADSGSFAADYDLYASASQDKPKRVRQDLLGQPMPQLRFIKHDGSILNIADNFGKHKTAFIILRGFGGQVCPYCAGQTRAVMTRLKEFQEADTEVVFCYPGPASAIPRFLQAVALLGDDTPPVTLALDIELQLVRALDIERDLSKPTSIILDQQGTIRYAYVGIDLSDRPTVDDLLRAINKANAP